MVQEYTHRAEQYDSQWSFYIEATTRETLARLPLRPTDSLLDIGCGNGALLEPLARTFPHAKLAGMDPVANMLALARRKLPSRASLCGGWAEQLPYKDASFDVVVSCNMFHYVREPRTALEEMMRVLRPGGWIVITDWCDDYLACRICAGFVRLFSSALFKVYRGQECLNLFKSFGGEAAVERYKISWLWGLMTVRFHKQPK